ncbi:mitogen-activated protein kinase kinase kinase 5 isoform X2 [Hevea brasiliensis]|uniref:mitogen-activated protein kinase kinase kinase 5 isoform X2 n=1 Tax=Hevea brasiliensis TaxID=3981 RepID=UPI0025F353D7|nr:mitogen-activated protein kinase kinase kinase 5 isoform X2 [Hevea brasiliensis]
MHFFQKAVSSSSASPSAPSVSSKDSSANACNIVINRGQSSFTQRRLTRQRKLRHVSDRELGFQFIDPLNSPPSSPDSARKQRYLGCSDRWSSAVPQPLPLPEWHLTKRPESLGSIFGQGLSGSPEEGRSSVLRRSGADRVVTKFATCSSNCHQRFSQEANVDGANYNLRLNIAARSAPTSRFSSPMVSPRRSNVEELFPHDVTDSTKYSSKCCKGQPLDLNAESFKHKLSRNASPRSAPISGFSSPAVSPQRSNTGHFLPSFVASQACHKRTTLEVLDLAAPPQSSMPSPPAILHQTIEKPDVSSRITQWQKGKLIGRGTYGSVYVGTNRETGALCAMKEVDIIPDDRKSAECIKQLEQEIRLLQHLKHPNIVQYYGSEIVDDHFYIYLEYVYPGSISKYVHEHCGVMTESIVRNFTCHILSGLDYLHSTKTIHRDIKGANLLVDSSGVVKLADFGMAKCLTGLSYELSLKGSPHWMAPEVINAVTQKDANPDLALAVDIWSLGCTVIEMFTGKPPWGELQGPQAMFKVLNKSPPIPEAMSPEAKYFLNCCFQGNPAERPSASMLLEHPFVLNSSELNALASRQTLSAINLKDKSRSSRDCAAQKIDLMPTSPDAWIMNDKMPSNSENGQQSCVKTFNCAATSYHSPCSPLEVLPCLSTSQLVYDSHNFTSSSNVSSNMPLGAVNYHPLALLRSHGREVPNI